MKNSLSINHSAKGSLDLTPVHKRVAFGNHIKSMNRIMQAQLGQLEEENVETFRDSRYVSQGSATMNSDTLLQRNKLKALVKKNPGNPKLQKLPETKYKSNPIGMEPISSGDSDFGRDEDLEVDNHLPKERSIYQRALAKTRREKTEEPIIWPT